jgi:chromosome segregation protein
LYKLKSLELVGFKSFADRTRLQFGDGVAAIVGPNGCGKSNLSDAISWVLGEQSARLLRGERMADVIFNGTGTRPPTSLAEASLTLIDPEVLQAGASNPSPPAKSQTRQNTGVVYADGLGAGPGDNGSKGEGAIGYGNGDGEARPYFRHRAGEITVTRRLFRSGESEYLINGEVCRLRDIQDLFMGTGLGPESYAIIEQGRIGLILSSRPADRRLMIEEAAGISKFKTRKRLAEAKLESSRQNLLRIADILEEVTRQVNSLKRQAAKARRYRELQTEMRGRLRGVLASRLRALDLQCQALRAESARAQQDCAEAGRQLEALEQEQRAVTLRHEELEKGLVKGRETLAQQDLERERLQARLEQMKQRSASLEVRAAEAAREKEQTEAQLGALEQEAQERQRQCDQLQQDWRAAQKAVAQLLARQQAVGNQVQAAEGNVEDHRQALLSAVSRGAELRNQLVKAEEMGLALARQAARTQAERAGLQVEHQRLEAALATAIADHQRETTAFADLAEAVSRTSAALEEARAEQAALDGELEKLRQEFSGAQARRQALGETLARHAYTTDGVRRLLAGHSGNGYDFRPLGLLADFVAVTPGYEEVVEQFLKQELDCVVVEQLAEARSGIALLQREGTGTSTFFVTHFSTNGQGADALDAEVRREPGVKTAVRELVRFESRLGLNGDATFPALESAYVVEDASSAERLAAKYPRLHFLTPSGEHYHHRLVSGGRGASSGPLALRRDFRELERRVETLEKNLHEVDEKRREVTAHGARLAEELRRTNALKLEAEKNALVANEKLRQVREACERAAERLRALAEEAADLETELHSAVGRQQQLRGELETANEEKLRREQAVSAAAAQLRELRAQLERLNQELAEAQAKAQVLEERNQALEAGRIRLARQAEEVRARAGKLQNQIEGWAEEQRQLAGECEQVLARLNRLEIEQQATRAGLKDAEQESEATRARREALRPLVEEARAALELRREARSQVEISLARAESDYAHHTQQCQEALNIDPAQLLQEVTPETALTGEALQAAEAEIQQMKARLESMEPVNLMALDELQEAEERFTFLDTQRQDLLASIEDTTQAIREIDRVSRQQFLEAFKAINIHFAESFRTLFGGGVGEMRLTDEGDPESGIDVVAQPPGKRLQNVLLLSGGEKALAALALLIAIFRYTPSPFCVLDEVDAPLDETNIERFTRMIQQMSRHTQFILITHSKRTMEIAPVLYGVTMEEPGVSKLVSVRFDAFERQPVVAR